MSEVVEVNGDTIYVRDNRYSPRDDARPLFATIDWLTLAKQKTALVKLIWEDQKNLLWGLVEFLDEVQDQAESEGYPVVYGYDLELYREDNPDAEIPDGKD